MTVDDQLFGSRLEHDQSSGANTIQHHDGWLLIDSASQFPDGMSSLSVDGVPLLAIRQGDDVSIYPDRCPHRGARLSAVGVHGCNTVQCRFHGKQFSLLGDGPSLEPYPTVRRGDLLFLALSYEPSGRGLSDFLDCADPDCSFLSGVSEVVPGSPRDVIENAFDWLHFHAVHRVALVYPGDVDHPPGGSMRATATFTTPRPPWSKLDTPLVDSVFSAQAFSPGLVMSTLSDGGAPVTVITSAWWGLEGVEVRIGFITPAEKVDLVPSLRHFSKVSLQQDAEFWRERDPTAPQHLDQADFALAAFDDFCEGFEWQVDPWR